MWLMLQQDAPDDYVIATGETHSVREFAEKVFRKLNLNLDDYLEIDPHYFRPTEVDVLRGNALKARKTLNWKPRVHFNELIDLMIASDLELARKEKALLDAGFKTCAQSRG
jgi:GDPmannose 4,6-dehydratase